MVKQTHKPILLLVSVLIGCADAQTGHLQDVRLFAKGSGKAISESSVSTLGLSEQAKRVVPNLLERLSSEDPAVGFQLIDELVVVELRHDLIHSSLRYDLSPSDYSVILRKVLPVLIAALSSSDSTASIIDQVNAGGEKSLSASGLKSRLLMTIDKITERYEFQDVAPLLAPLAEDDDPLVTRKAVRTLVRLRCPLAAPYLISQLHPEQPHQTYNAIKDLVRINAVEAAERIVSLLEAEDSNTRYWALWALVKLNARQYRDRVFEVVEQNRDESAIETYGLAALVKWDDPRAIRMAMKWLKSTDRNRRTMMSDRLAELGASQIAGGLIDLLRDPATIGGDKGTNANIRRQAMSLLATLSPTEAIPVLRELARGEHNFLAMTAVEELGRIRAVEGLPEVLALLDRRDPSGGNWHAATLALAKIGRPDTIPRLLADLKNRRPGSHHVETLLCLNIASDRDTYHRLCSVELENVEARPAVEALAEFSRQSGMRIVLSRNVHAVDSHRVVAGFARARMPASTVLDRILNVLNQSGHKYSIFIENGVMNVATIPEIYEFWEQWLRLQGLGTSEKVNAGVHRR
ncbi:MAG: HEAT repeat domain-containing protein [Planctomycetota bacterium]